MAGPPLRSGSLQVTARLSVAPETAVTVGFAGLAGCSFTFVTVTVMVWIAVCTRSPVPLVACTVTS